MQDKLPHKERTTLSSEIVLERKTFYILYRFDFCFKPSDMLLLLKCKQSEKFLGKHSLPATACTPSLLGLNPNFEKEHRFSKTQISTADHFYRVLRQNATD